jgi:hypothetical protein
VARPPSLHPVPRRALRNPTALLVQPAAVSEWAAQIQYLCRGRQPQTLGSRTVVCGDGSYGNQQFLGPMQGQRCTVVVRLRRDRVLYLPLRPYSGRGRPASTAPASPSRKKAPGVARMKSAATSIRTGSRFGCAAGSACTCGKLQR